MDYKILEALELPKAPELSKNITYGITHQKNIIKSIHYNIYHIFKGKKCIYSICCTKDHFKTFSFEDNKWFNSMIDKLYYMEIRYDPTDYRYKITNIKKKLIK